MQLCFRYEENLKELHDPMQPGVVTERTRCGKVLSDGSRCRLLAPSAALQEVIVGGAVTAATAAAVLNGFNKVGFHSAMRASLG